MEEINPSISVQPKGDHKLVPDTVSGISPRIVVNVVSTIGINRRSLARRTAVALSNPSHIS